MTLSVSIPFVSFPVPPFSEGRQDALRQLVIFIRECPAVVFRHVVVVEPEVYGLAYLECSLVHCHYQCLHRLIALSTTRAILPMAPIITHLFMIHPPQTPLSAESPLRIARTSATLAPCRHAGRLRTPRPFLP